jgi:hypothetical protein
VDHGAGLASVYAHAAGLVVEKGEQVARGQTLGHLGDTGERAPFLYFELRDGGKPWTRGLAEATLTAPHPRGACRGGKTAIGSLRFTGARMTERPRTFRPRVVLLFASCLVVTLLLGGSLALGVGSEQSTHRR